MDRGSALQDVVFSETCCKDHISKSFSLPGQLRCTADRQPENIDTLKRMAGVEQGPG
jgi:hypothetical protein